MHKTEHKIKTMCRVLEVSRNGYYSWQRRGVSKREQMDDWLYMKIQDIFYSSGKRYGSPRIAAELRAKGIRTSRHRVAKIMREHGLKSQMYRRKYRIHTTNSKHRLPIAANLVEMKFNPIKPDNLWASDITYIRTKEGWLYLSVIVDLYSRKVISWSTSEFIDEVLVLRTIDKAIRARRPEEGLIFHSDRGSQYASFRVRNLLEGNNILQSMSSTGNCYDNAVIESFFSTLKKELVYQESYRTREEANLSLFNYIEVFYNRFRRHSTLGYVSPENFENLIPNTRDVA